MAAKKKAKHTKPSGAKKNPQTAAPVKSNAEELTVAKKNEVAVADKDSKKDSDSKQKKAPKRSGKNKKPNIFVRAINYIKSVITELKKVSWLTGDELLKSTTVVAGIVAILTLLVWVVDSGLGALAAMFIGSK
jgi:preprotein translocase subunit SecE